MTSTRISKYFYIFLMGICAFLCACATTPTNPTEREIYKQTNDPLEPINRVTTTFNLRINKYIFQPVSRFYRFVTPEFFRTGITNFSTNLKQPIIFVNAVLQGEFEQSAQTLGRFFTNTTLGIGGLFDIATKFDIEAPKKDFGQTLYTWGIKEDGYYLVLPILGPSNVRDTTGTIVNFFIDPINWALPERHDNLLWWKYGIQTVSEINHSTDLLENLDKSSVDVYVTLRTMYHQNRKMDLTGEETTKNDYDFSFDDFEEDI